MQDKELILLGYSGHSYVVAESALMCGFKLMGYAEKNEIETNPFKLSYLGDEKSSDFKGWVRNVAFILGIGDNMLRCKVSSYIQSQGFEVQYIIHPGSSVSSYTEIGIGAFIARNAAINPLCHIGENAIVNTSASIDHECILMEGCHIAPGAILAGSVSVGKRAFIGAGAVIKQNVQIGDDAVIGAGAVVLKDVKAGETVIGNPAGKKTHD